MQHLDAVSRLRARRPRMSALSSEDWMRERKPRYGRHDGRLHLPAREQLPQPRLDEDAVRGPRRVWIQRAERQDLHYARARASGPNISNPKMSCCCFTRNVLFGYFAWARPRRRA